MRQATTTLVMAAGSYRPLLAEDGTELLAEDGSTLYAEPTGAAVTITTIAPTVTVVTVAPTVTLVMKEST